MKKILGISAVAFSMLSLCSCSSEIDGPDSPSDNSVRITLSMPSEVLTRTFASGARVNQLTYAIYEKEEGKLIKSETVDAQFTNGSFTLETELVNGFEYDIVFWADRKSETPYYSFDSETKTIEMKDAAFVSNSDDIDAFFGKTTTDKITHGYNATVALTRPFAQINLGASDLTNTSFIHKFGENVSILPELEVKAYKKFNIFDGTVAGEKEDVTYAKPATAIDTENEPYPNNSDVNKYVGMHYMFADNTGDVVNPTYHFYTVDNSSTEFHKLTVPNVPVRQNYQTNIYGKIFTSDANLVIELNAGIHSMAWPLGATVVKTPDELRTAVDNAKAGSVILIPDGVEITYNATSSSGTIEGDILEPEADIEIVVDGVLNFTGESQITPMGKSTLRLSGNGTINKSSDAILLRAEDSCNIIVDGGLTFNINGERGSAGVARLGGTLTINNATINSNLTHTSVFKIAEDGNIKLNNSTVWSKSAICLYYNDDATTTEKQEMNLTATGCKFINNSQNDINWYAFEGFPNKAMQYVFQDSYIASNTGCVHGYTGNSVAIKGTGIKQHSVLSKFKNSNISNDQEMVPVVLEAGAKTLYINGYSAIYNEWNETDNGVATVLKKGNATNLYMLQSYYTGPTVDKSNGDQPIADTSKEGYNWGEAPANIIFNGGKVLNLSGEIVDKNQFFKFRYSK